HFGDTDNGDPRCRDLRVTSVDYVLPDGSTVRTPRRGAATLYHYEHDAGQELIPPAGWNPLSATDEELDTFGFPPRPGDPVGRAEWNSDFANWHRSTAQGMCVHEDVRK